MSFQKRSDELALWSPHMKWGLLQRRCGNFFDDLTRMSPPSASMLRLRSAANPTPATSCPHGDVLVGLYHVLLGLDTTAWAIMVAEPSNAVLPAAPVGAIRSFFAPVIKLRLPQHQYQG